ncbi:MAG: hypothetical protein JZU67_01470 [Burkholderiaceae bacterium]|nr:hypothetical protein [Burkholderiaceae bacterium]
MSDFKIEVGKHCANGAKVLAVFCNESEGVVLATWKNEYITWGFAADRQDSTAHGNYFMYDGENYGRKFFEAYADMVERIQRIIKGASV